MNRVFWGIAALLLPVSTTSLASQKLTDSEKTFSSVIETPGHSKDEIYIASKTWLAEHFKSSKAVIELESKEDGIIIGNPIIKFPCRGLQCMVKSDWTVPFTLKIETKDGKFRVTFSNIQIHVPATSGNPAYDSPVTSSSDMDSIKPALLQLGDEIATSVNKNTSNW